MTDTPDAPAVVDDPDHSRFELHIDGHLAHLDYAVEGDRLRLVHTIVPDALGGRGLGGLLVEAAVQRSVAGSLTIVPECTYVSAWLHKHPDAAARVAVDW